ncbi:Protein of unknown function [Parasphingorhabdus marina DSM 22363]|uniref:DUF3429 domain-containing protein n=1 Tax=Parasphingorhabdus marina DSM 22363 TaxID=1123272 RepID=A0A1N6CS16_9SPHN|nr:DUF3429 family protein [Parasphingorhabdus marina]SIN61184.1 Protein of unknown function [Parasphingorhabdus marina DSM 22363]
MLAPGKSLPPSALWLGLAGLLPQTLCLVLVFDDQHRFSALAAGWLYAALIFSFLGGVWWGLGVADERPPAWLFPIAVLPSLIAFASGIPWMIGTTWPGPSMLLLGAGLILALFVDRALFRRQIMSAAMFRLRILLSAGLGSLTLALGLLA